MKLLDKFANIGKAVLVQSLGLQKNYTEQIEEETEIIDYNNTACQDCKYRALINSFKPGCEAYNNATAICAACPKKQITTQVVYKKIYHNEKNKYGYKPRLKTNAIKLLLLLHFCHPDRFGIVQNLNVDMLAIRLGCDVKTIKNNLNTLTQYGYISYCKLSPHFINLCLCDYEQYYLPANKGGRGFFVMSEGLLNELLNINNLLSLRIHLRELIEIDNLNAKGPFTAISKSYKELKLSLPDYCKPCNIRRAISVSDGIFDISFKENSIRFEISDIFNCRKQKQICYDQYMDMFEAFVRDFNDTVGFVNSNLSSPGKYSNFFDVDAVSTEPFDFRLIKLKPVDYEDLAGLAMQYSYEHVMFALSQIYKSYIINERRITNLGGLVRTAIVANQNLITDSLAA